MSEYIERINSILKPQKQYHTRAIDLFAGCGGLALGFEARGFLTHGYELDAGCSSTYEKNLTGECTKVSLSKDTPLEYAPVVIGGPPCQPFSVGGHQLGLEDSRDGFPVFISAVEKIQPEIWLFENVRGLLYQSKSYFDEILEVLQSLGYIIEYSLSSTLSD
jgi:DNA (cytosine-5)-methyltransferase 1